MQLTAVLSHMPQVTSHQCCFLLMLLDVIAAVFSAHPVKTS